MAGDAATNDTTTTLRRTTRAKASVGQTRGGPKLAAMYTEDCDRQDTTETTGHNYEHAITGPPMSPLDETNENLSSW